MFYANRYHEVSKLTFGHCMAFIYHCTATPFLHHPLSHLSLASSSLSQPANESIARSLFELVELLLRENNESYPMVIGGSHCWYPKVAICHSKPKKLAVVLSHHYSATSLTGIQALKTLIYHGADF
jgi:hypothetical protein